MPREDNLSVGSWFTGARRGLPPNPGQAPEEARRAGLSATGRIGQKMRRCAQRPNHCGSPATFKGPLALVPGR